MLTEFKQLQQRLFQWAFNRISQAKTEQETTLRGAMACRAMLNKKHVAVTSFNKLDEIKRREYFSRANFTADDFQTAHNGEYTADLLNANGFHKLIALIEYDRQQLALIACTTALIDYRKQLARQPFNANKKPTAPQQEQWSNAA
ncbi:hypothetical protein ACFQ02_03785 [Seminibacterium arietis]|uniref:Uncharacterized protein n=1 Tax=Seminibacterium arietis TaxID=1173502 RepID=A0ABW3I8A7_9PAST